MHVEGKLLRWGNSYGIRLRKADVDKLGIRPGDRIAADLQPPPGKTVDDLPVWHLGGVDDLDAAAGAGFAQELP